MLPGFRLSRDLSTPGGCRDAAISLPGTNPLCGRVAGNEGMPLLAAVESSAATHRIESGHRWMIAS